MTLTGSTITHEEFLTTLRRRFGESPSDWAFVCPTCGDVATGDDFKAALAEHPRERRDGTKVTASDVLGQECIGRTLGALSREPYAGRGCDWCAFGLFRGPLMVVVDGGGDPVPSFNIATEAEVSS